MGYQKNDDYIEVAERIAEFKAAYPDGVLRPVDPETPFRVLTIGDRTFITYAAAAYRSPDDTLPGIGVASEPFPGTTPYTKNSELQNAETSAWGRAIVALGIASNRKIASANEVRARASEREAAQAEPQLAPEPPATVSMAQAEQLRAVIVAKGKDLPRVMAWLRDKHGMGDGESLLSIPADAYADLVQTISGWPDPEPIATRDAESKPEAQAEASDPRSLPRQVLPYGCAFAGPGANPNQRCPDIDEGQPPSCGTCEKFDPTNVDWQREHRAEDLRPTDDRPYGVLDAPAAEAEKPRKKGSISPEQLTRVCAQTGELERLGVAPSEWRAWMKAKFDVDHRDELVKTTTATKAIDGLAQWLTDLKTGVAGPSERRK